MGKDEKFAEFYLRNLSQINHFMTKGQAENNIKTHLRELGCKDVTQLNRLNNMPCGKTWYHKY